MSEHQEPKSSGQLFRKKSIDRISSPEQLHDYMRVTSPRLWMILSVILALLVGLIILSATLRMEETISVEAQCDGDLIIIPLTQAQNERVRPGMEVRIGQATGTVEFMYQDDAEYEASVTMNDTSLSMEKGTYDAEIVTETTTPISFLFN